MRKNSGGIESHSPRVFAWHAPERPKLWALRTSAIEIREQVEEVHVADQREDESHVRAVPRLRGGPGAGR